MHYFSGRLYISVLKRTKYVFVESVAYAFEGSYIYLVRKKYVNDLSIYVLGFDLESVLLRYCNKDGGLNTKPKLI